MPTPEFTDPRQVAIYDAVNSYEPGTQPNFYLGVAEEVGAETVIDLGCGTGIITLEFREEGLSNDRGRSLCRDAGGSPAKARSGWTSSGSRGMPDNWERRARTWQS